MKLKLALCLLTFPLVSIAAPPKVAYEMVNKVNGEIVRTDVLVKEGDRCKIYSKDIFQTFITTYTCKLDTSKFYLGNEKLSTCYAESSGEEPSPTAEADQHFLVNQNTPHHIELKSRASEEEYILTVTLKKIDLKKLPEKVGDSRCLL